MHKLNVLILGSPSFILTLNELKNFLKFNPLAESLSDNYNIILFHSDAINNEGQKELINNSKKIKICVGFKKNDLIDYDAYLQLPASLKEINGIVENTSAKKNFYINSSIGIKSYILNKNEKKLSKLEKYIILTEKEIQLLELFLKSNKPITKDKILSLVWNYSADADTHTVETHIYRLRKKILDKFMDNKFILNKKDGYCL